MKVRFGDVVFDSMARRVVRADGEVHLSGKAFELLRLLIEKRPDAVSKGDLQNHLWPDTFVTEANLPSLMAEIRDAIGDDAREPKYIATLYGFGYAFRGAVTEDSGAPTAVASGYSLATAGEPIPLVLGENILGRDSGITATLESATVSRRHARILVEGGQATIEDLGSKNGTFVNNEAVTSPRGLKDGDQIRIASFLFTFRLTPPGVTTLTETTSS